MTAPDVDARRRGTGRRASDRSGRLRPATALPATGLFVLCLAAALLPAWPIYRSADVVVMAGVTVLAGCVIALAGAALRLSSLAVLVLTVVAYLVLGVPLAVPSQTTAGVLPTLDGLVALLAGTALGWKQLVTISLPVGSYEALLVPMFVLLLVASVVGLSVALRSRRGELALLAPAVVLLAGILLGPAEAVRPVLTGSAVLGTTVAWFVWWRLRRRRVAVDALVGRAGGSWSHGHGSVAVRAVVGSAATVAVALAAAAGAEAVLPSSGERTVGRTLVEQPFDPRDEVSPLTRLRVYEQEPAVDETLFTVEGLAAGQLLRLATLDTYDGVSFTVGSSAVTSASGSFDRVPAVVDQSAVVGSPASLAVTVDGYRGVWLPTVGQLEDVAFSGPTADDRRAAFFYNDVTGTAAVVGGLSAGDAYRLDAVLPDAPADDELASLTPGSATVPAPSDVPDELTAALDAWTADVQGPGAQLVAALDALRAEGYVSHGVSADEPRSRSGHGSDRLAQLFTDPVMVGDAEQYAAAAALMADRLGFPSRVVMGFVPEAAQEGAPGPVDVTGADVTARIEVDTAEHGWVSLDPVPEERPVPDDIPQDPNQVSRPQSVVQPPLVEPPVRDEQSPPRTAQDESEAPPAWIGIALLVARVAGWAALVAGLVAAPLLTIVALKARRRRRRRRAPDPVQRITGGWQEFEDAVVDHGVETPPAATRSEVAAVVGGARTAVLARVADRAVFAPAVPAAEDADRVWTAVSDMRRQLGVGLTRWQRFRAAVSLRSLRGYHGRTPTERERTP